VGTLEGQVNEGGVVSVSEPAPARGPVEAAVEEFWRPGSLEDVVGAVEPWRAEDAGAADVSDDEWDAFVRALAE
jgi:hypothetical protein